VRVATTIGREYAIAAILGFTAEDLRGFTRNGVRASFAPRARRTAILADSDAASTKTPSWYDPIVRRIPDDVPKRLFALVSRLRARAAEAWLSLAQFQ